MADEQPIRVLHVDDDEDVLDLTATFLERTDELQVSTATSASEALSRLDEETFDCIVSDYDMPGSDGLDLLTAVRNRGLSVPFILFTGHGNEAVASEAISVGVSDYLQKGAGADQYDVLANRIRNYADQYQTEREIERIRRRYELVASATSDVIFEWDGETDHILFSAGFAEHFGTDLPDNADEEWWLSKMHPDDREEIRDRLAETIANEEVELTIEYRFEHADGGYRYVTEDRHNDFDDDGTVTRVVGAFRDVTERRQREQHLDSLHEASRELMTVDEVDEVVETVSRAAKEILNLPIHAIYRREGDLLRPVSYTSRAESVFGCVPEMERGEGLLWDAYEEGETRIYRDVSDHENAYNPETEIRGEFHVPFGDFGVFVAGSTVRDDVAETDVSLTKVLVANAEAALARVRSG